MKLTALRGGMGVLSGDISSLCELVISTDSWSSTDKILQQTALSFFLAALWGQVMGAVTSVCQ